MLKPLIVSAVALSLSSLPAAAEDKMVVDMSKMTCGELTKLGFQDFAGITMWLSGSMRACATPPSTSTSSPRPPRP